MDVSTCWISLEESQARVAGRLQWWRLESVDGECVDTHQQHALGPKDRPVRVYSNRSMYLGGWKDGAWHGLGILCGKNGQVTIGVSENNSFTGICKQVWLPQSRVWTKNIDTKSPILSREYYNRDINTKRTVPFIYIGKMKGLVRCDDFARVVLQDGTTRVGPWRNGRPVGDWWGQHEEHSIHVKDLQRLLLFKEDSCPELPRTASNRAMGKGRKSELEWQVQNRKDLDASTGLESASRDKSKKGASNRQTQQNAGPRLRRSLSERLFGKGRKTLQIRMEFQGRDEDGGKNQIMNSSGDLGSRSSDATEGRHRLCGSLSSVMEDFSSTSASLETASTLPNNLVRAKEESPLLLPRCEASEEPSELFATRAEDNNHRSGLSRRSISSGEGEEDPAEFQTRHEAEDELFEELIEKSIQEKQGALFEQLEGKSSRNSDGTTEQVNEEVKLDQLKCGVSKQTKVVDNTAGGCCTLPETSQKHEIILSSARTQSDMLVSTISIQILPQTRLAETKDNEDSFADSIATSYDANDDLQPMPPSSWNSYAYFI